MLEMAQKGLGFLVSLLKVLMLSVMGNCILSYRFLCILTLRQVGKPFKEFDLLLEKVAAALVRLILSIKSTANKHLSHRLIDISMHMVFSAEVDVISGLMSFD